jgi:hypothetical protein
MFRPDKSIGGPIESHFALSSPLESQHAIANHAESFTPETVSGRLSEFHGHQQCLETGSR